MTRSRPRGERPQVKIKEPLDTSIEDLFRGPTWGENKKTKQKNYVQYNETVGIRRGEDDSRMKGTMGRIFSHI